MDWKGAEIVDLVYIRRLIVAGDRFLRSGFERKRKATAQKVLCPWLPESKLRRCELKTTVEQSCLLSRRGDLWIIASKKIGGKTTPTRSADE
jgi:hypothetical protein